MNSAKVKLTGDGEGKVLDFGLAKAFGDEASARDLSQSPTLTREGTRAGVIMGTASYMSPEQARGKTVDKRTDIFAFGCCLYEALAQRKAFGGETVTDVLAAIINKDPDWEALPESTPWEIRKLVRRCLSKDPRRRLHDIADARNEIEETATEPRSQEPQLVPRTRLLPLMAATALVSVLTGILIASLMRPGDALTRPSSRLTINVPDEGLREGIEPPIAISRDGRRVVMVVDPDDGPPRLYLRSLDQFEAIPMPGTENARLPFFSPDGQWVGFWAGRSLLKVAVTGGAPIEISEVPIGFRGASWGPDDTIILGGANTGLLRVSALGGAPVALTTTDVDRREDYHAWPEVMPNGRDVLFTIHTSGAGESSDIGLLSLETGNWRILEGTRGAVQPRYLDSGHLVYARGAGLVAIPFDAKQLAAIGSPVPVQSGVNRRRHSGLEIFDFDVSRTGSLVYVSAANNDTQMVLVDREGRQEPLAMEKGITYVVPAFRRMESDWP